MNICLIGNGLTNIVLAKNLLNKKIKVDLFCEKKNLKKIIQGQLVYQKKT